MEMSDEQQYDVVSVIGWVGKKKELDTNMWQYSH